MAAAEQFWYVLQCLAFTAGYFAKFPTKEPSVSWRSESDVGLDSHLPLGVARHLQEGPFSGIPFQLVEALGNRHNGVPGMLTAIRLGH
jgi:hypothetical protein